jgi:peptidoglycan hydrolase-like protein with peptidoglycan-binding domain
VFSTLADLKSFVAALREFDPKEFIVDWGLAGSQPDFDTIEQGDSGSRVEALQNELNRVFTNVSLVTDGKFGPKTYDAVVLFQKLKGLTQTGKVNEETWDKLKACANESLTNPAEPVPQPGKKTLIIPWATQIEPYKTSREYEKGYPKGLVVHFTATGPTPAQEKSVDEYMRPRWSVFMLKRSGELCQTFPLNKGGSHCGTWHHDVCLGVEIVAAGRCTPVTLNGVKKYVPWYAYKDGVLKYPEMAFTEDQMRYSGPNKIKNIYPGWYQKYTQAQEDTLFKLCMFLKEQAPDYFDFDLVVGHDEACDVGGRAGDKNDPGAALSMDMPAFREKLKKAWAER